MYLNFVSLRWKSLFKALLLLSTCVFGETIIFETHPKYYILWSINQTYHFCQDIYFIHILLSLSCGDILSDGLKKKNETMRLLTLSESLHFFLLLLFLVIFISFLETSSCILINLKWDLGWHIGLTMNEGRTNPQLHLMFPIF